MKTGFFIGKLTAIGSTRLIFTLQSPHVILRHARPCAGHPRLSVRRRQKVVDGRAKPGHDAEN
jgi:hypothetical protein